MEKGGFPGELRLTMRYRDDRAALDYSFQISSVLGVLLTD
jgi:hypothetical protein